MKNSEIHKGLHKSEIRDFLSQSLIQCFDDEGTQQNIKEERDKHLRDSYYPIDYNILMTKSTIEYQVARLAILERRKAIDLIMNNMNWKKHDVSDETSKDHKFSLYMNFIGTDEEYKTLINSIKK